MNSLLRATLKQNTSKEEGTEGVIVGKLRGNKCVFHCLASPNICKGSVAASGGRKENPQMDQKDRATP